MMTSISSNSAALTILTQTPPTVDSSKSAADNILSIVSGGSTGATDKAEEARLAKLAAQKAKIAALDQPREAGGSVSSEISSTWSSAMSQVVQGTTLAYAPVEGQAVQTTAASNVDPWDEALKGATDRAVLSVGFAIALNAKDHLFAEVDLDARALTTETQRQAKVAGGMSEADADAWATREKRFADVEATAMKMINATLVNRANNMSFYYNQALEQHGVAESVKIDANGTASVSAFDLKNSAGQKLVSLSDEGVLTTYNSDGSVRKQMGREELALETRGMGNDFLTMLHRSGTDLNNIKLY